MATNSSRKSNTTSKSRQNKNLKIAGRRKLGTQGSESSKATPRRNALINKVSGATKAIGSKLGLGQRVSKSASR